MPTMLIVLAVTTFAAALSSRAMDPVLPSVAGEMGVSIATAAGLSAGVAFAFAVVQPIVGVFADLLGKTRIVMVCLIVLAAANIAGAFATSFSMLFTSRILCGLAAGGIFPIALGLTGDLVPLAQRQVALSRVLAGAMTGTLLGASFTGVISDLVGWRFALILLGAVVLLAAAAVAVGFRGSLRAPSQPIDFGVVRRGYKAILANPNARVCFTAVFVEGVVIFGLMPFVAAFLFDLGETRLSIAGLVISGFAAGGLLYAALVSFLLPRLRVNGMMISGAIVIGLQFAVIAYGPTWPVQLASFTLMGLGFYMLHGSLQVFSSDLAPEARASALSLHAFCFFIGQTIGPLLYGAGLEQIGKAATLGAAGLVIVALGFAASRLLKQRPATPPEMLDV